MTTYLIQVSDTHINSTVALCARGVNLDDGGTYHLNRTQSFIWASWLSFWQEVEKLKGRKIVVFNGDLAELDTKRRSLQLISANKSTIIKLIHAAMAPVFDADPEKIIFIRGTTAHEGKGCWVEETFADDCTISFRDDANKRASWYHMRAVIDGVALDIAHHANMTGNPWGRSNSANLVAKKITWAYKVDMDQRAPDIAMRAHNHKVASSSGFPVLVQFGPAWTGPTEYSYRVGYENILADIGGIIWTLDNGAYTSRLIQFKPPESRRVWAIKI